MRASQPDYHDHTEALRGRLTEAEDMLRAIQQGDIDALVVQGAGGDQIYTLHTAEEPYRNLIDQLQEGAVVLAGNSDILYSNARFAALVGEPLESVVGSRIERFVSAPDRHDFAALLGAGSGRRRSRLIGADRGTVEVSLSLTTTMSPNGNRLNLIVSDLRELLETNADRDRGDRDRRTKNEFVTMLAHELRNPLGAISNAVQVLTSGAEPKTRAREVIARQIGHISRLIEDLLDVERVVSGRLRLNRRPIDMAEAILRAVASFTGDVRLDRHIDLSIQPAWVHADAVRIEQVLTNLMINAIKYTPPGGQIGVTLRADGDDAVLVVEDSGVGISPDLMPFIFDMYVQSERTLEHAGGGLGVGLTLVRHLVELHGGTIEASSAGAECGSRFTVRLKRVAAAEPSHAASPPLERSAKPRRVLLIDDSHDAREMLRVMLQHAGHIVYDAADGIHGLELLEVVRPDVGIIDISLPRMDGYQVARRIREDPIGRGMLLLALTGFGVPGDLVRSSEAGFDYHFLKPVNPQELVRVLNRFPQGPA